MRNVSTASGGPARAYAWRIFAIVAVAQVMVVLDATIVFVALPSIQTDLGLSPTEVQWVVNAYVLTFGGFLLLGGRLADLLGRRRLFVVGTLLFTVASAMNAAAPSGEVLVAARAIQGLGAALVSPAALSIVTTSFAQRPDRTRAMSAWAAIAGGSGAVGLVAGGALTEWLSWEWIFLINLPLGVIAVAAALSLLPSLPGSGTGESFDLAGAVTGTLGLVVLAYGIVQTESHGWGSGRTIGLLAGAALLLTVFVAIEARGRQPLVRLGIFRIRALAVANGICALAMAVVMPVFLFITIYLQEVLRLTPIEAGLAFLPYMTFILAGSAASSRMIRFAGIPRVLVAGLAGCVPGLLLLAQVDVGTGYGPGVLPGLCMLGIGMGLVLVPVTIAATAAVPSGESGLASGLYNTSLQLGGALGIAVMSTVAQHATAAAAVPGQAALVDGYQLAFAIGAAAMLAGAALASIALRPADVAGIAVDEPLQLVT